MMIVSTHSIEYFVSGQWCTASLISTVPPDYTAITREIITGEFEFTSGGQLRLDVDNGYLLIDICEDEVFEGELRLALIRGLLDQKQSASGAFAMT